MGRSSLIKEPLGLAAPPQVGKSRGASCESRSALDLRSSASAKSCFSQIGYVQSLLRSPSPKLNGCEVQPSHAGVADLSFRVLLLGKCAEIVGNHSQVSPVTGFPHGDSGEGDMALRRSEMVFERQRCVA